MYTEYTPKRAPFKHSAVPVLMKSKPSNLITYIILCFYHKTNPRPARLFKQQSAIIIMCNNNCGHAAKM